MSTALDIIRTTVCISCPNRKDDVMINLNGLVGRRVTVDRDGEIVGRGVVIGYEADTGLTEPNIYLYVVWEQIRSDLSSPGKIGRIRIGETTFEAAFQKPEENAR